MKLVNESEAARVLGMGRGQIGRGADAGRYPYLIVRARRMYDLDALREIIDAERAGHSPEEGVDWNTIRDVTGLSNGAMREGIEGGWLPYWRVGRRYRFDPEEVAAAILRQMRANVAGKGDAR